MDQIQEIDVFYEQTDFQCATEERRKKALHELEKEEAVRSLGNQEKVQKFLSNKGAMVGLVVILLIVLFALVGPYVTPYTYNQVETGRQNLPPRIPVLEKTGIFNGVLKGVGLYTGADKEKLYFYFGTDTLGRDLWARASMGTRVSLFVAVVAVLIDMVIGVTFGLISGYFGGVVDLVMQRIIEILAGIPSIAVVTLLMIVLKPGLLTIIIALMMTNWIGMSRLVRAQVLRLKEQEYVLAARTLGASHRTLMFKEIIPNLLSSIIVMAMMSIPGAIFMESFLSFIGLGIPEPLASLGTLISTGYKKMMIYPYMVAIPVVIFVALMISFNLVADGLRDAFDPQMKEA